jgi:hypothetical protein
MVNRKESTADIKISVGEEEVTVESLSATKNIDIETIYGSGQTLPDGYAINQVSYEGDMTCKGNRLDLEDKLFDENGIPEVFNVSITHLDGTPSGFQECLCTSEGYEASSGDTTETTFSFIAMRKRRGGQVDSDPTE